jgi:transposase-like protein
MTLIGMLHHRRNPHNVKKAYAYAAVAKAEGLTFFLLYPREGEYQTAKNFRKIL